MHLRARLRRLPPLARRDARIAELQARRRALKSEAGRLNGRIAALEREVASLRAEQSAAARRPVYHPTEPSWYSRSEELARVGAVLKRIDTSQEHPRRRLLLKLHNYELARSHGIATPRVIGVWDRVADMPWEDLPERFVIKSNGGAGGRGVLPLTRTTTGFRMLDGTRDYSPAQIIEHYRDRGRFRPPYFAEEFLHGGAEVLPDDVKIYAYYGEVADVMMRRMPEHGDLAKAQYRFLDAQGRDLGQVQRRHKFDPSISPPRDLGLMVQIASALSTSVPLPVIRVDLYQVPDGVVLGELTPMPGSANSFTRDHDRFLGARYDEAEARLQLDLARGRPFDVLFGGHSRDVTRAVPATRALATAAR